MGKELAAHSHSRRLELPNPPSLPKLKFSFLYPIRLCSRIKPRFFMLAEAACCFVCPMMLIEKTRLPDFEYVIH
jgi:hypothetical protein